MDNFKLINETFSNENIQLPNAMHPVEGGYTPLLPIVIYYNQIINDLSYYVIKNCDKYISLEIYTEILLEDSDSVAQVLKNNSTIKVEKYRVTETIYEHIIYSYDKLYFKNKKTLKNFLTFKLLGNNNLSNNNLSNNNLSNNNLSNNNLSNNNLSNNNLTIMFANIIDMLDSNNVRLKGAHPFIYKQFQDYNNKSSYKFNKYFNKYMNMLGDIYI
jgi:hypothetical protein